MAEEHDESIPIQHINTSADISVSGNDIQTESVCTIVPSAGSNDGSILLYVDENATRGVHDLLRVALNSSAAGGLQQQLENAKITLGNIADNSTIISMPMAANGITPDSAGLLQGAVGQSLPQSGAGVVELEHHQQVVNVVHSGEVKSIEMNNLFQLASLTADNLVGGNLHGDIDNSVIMKNESDDDEGDSSIGEFIIANVDPDQKLPGEINIGDEFYCFEAVEEALHQYEEKNNVKLYKRDVRSLEALLKRSLKLQRLEKINEHLKYGQLLYCCVFGGKRKAQKLACIDESGFARYTDCKMYIRFAISDDGMKLIVNGKEEVHNHDTVVSNEQEPEQYITNPGNADEIKLGAGFEDLEELYKAVNKYETDNHVHLWRRDGRTVEALAKRAPGTAKKIMDTNPGLRFAELRFCCSYGGRQISSEDKKEKRLSNSFKQGCEMHIRFGISEDGSQLVVKSMSEEHNHEINEETVVKEALHPDLCVYVSKIVWNDLNVSVDEVKTKLEDYVTGVMFKGQSPPPRTRRQYFPSKKQIRYFMTKAKGSLNISQESEQKLQAQAEKLKEEHKDEKLIFNFKVQHEINYDMGNDESNDRDDSLLNQSNSVASQNEQNAKLLFCHQTPHQQRMLRRYNTQVLLTQVSNLHSKIPFPLFCMYVQTNVDYQLVGEFIVQANSSSMINEGLQKIKEWNPGWTPKFVVVDFSDDQISAVETAFPNSFVLISDSSREKAWSEWLSMESNGVSDFQDDVIKYLDAIANSYSEETLNMAARELEESDVWKMSDKMRNWFQLNWLAQAKRWVVGYRPEDYVMTLHNGRLLDDELKIFKTIKLTNKASPLQDLIQQLVEHAVPVSKKQYEILNKDSFRLQSDLYYIYSDIPNYLTNRPGKLTHHIHERIKIASGLDFMVADIHPGIFSVQGMQLDDDVLHTVSFGDNNNFPSCDCSDWQRFKLPCVHFCAVFSNFPEWSWDMMSVNYRCAPMFNVDWAVSISGTKKDIPGFLVDNGTQTTSANLIGTPSELRITKVGDIQRIMETPQVLASQCRGLLQQLSKLQLAHHSRENLNRLKSELKELISRFSTPQNCATNVNTTDRLVMSKGKKTDLSSNRSVFEQYGVKLVTPKQVTDAVDIKLHSSSIIKRNEQNSPGDTAVDSLLLSTDHEHHPEMITEQVSSQSVTLPVTTLTINSIAPNTRKRVQSPSVFFKPAVEKRIKKEVVTAAKNIGIHTKPGLQFSANNTTISAVIDGQTVNIPLEQMAAVVAEAEETTLSSLETDETVESDTTIK